MTLLRKYIFAEFMRFFLMTFIAITAVYLCVEFLQKADDFIHRQANFGDVVSYFLYNIPAIATPSLPIAALLATILSLGNLSRHNEIIAMYSGGVSLAGVIAPALFAGVLLSFVGFINNELIMPHASARANIIRYERIEKKPHIVLFRQQNLWLRGPGNSIANIDFSAPDKNELIGITIFKFNPDFTVRERIRARRLVLEAGQWRLREGTKYILTRDRLITSPVDGDVYNVVETPADLNMIVKSSDEMSFRELWEYVRRLRASGYYLVKYDVALQEKLSMPFACLVMVMIATPLSLLRVRSGGAGWGVAIAILLAFCYWTLTSIGSTFGRSGILPPLVSAWFSNIVFLSAAIVILRRMRTAR